MGEKGKQAGPTLLDAAEAKALVKLFESLREG